MPAEETKERIYKGIAACPGVAHSSAFVFLKRELEVPKREVAPERREEEIARFEQGLFETRRQISAIRAEIEEKLGDEEAAIFDAHQLVLEDRALIEETINEVVESGLNIEYCFQKVAQRYIDAFSHIDDEYIKERVADIKDVSRRLLSNLLGKRETSLQNLPHDCIIVADDLSPSDTAHLDASKVLAVVTDQGGRTSHSVIMARSIGIPCVVGLHDLTSKVQHGQPILVDGFDGLVITDPTERSLFRYGKIQTERQLLQKKFLASKHLPALTRDNRELKLLLNIEGHEEDRIITDSGTEGVGLFRTEFLFLSAHKFPDEEHQFNAYKRIVEAADPHPVTIRTLDLGGDKNPYVNLCGYEEANPFMGFRAIRFCLEHKDVFKTQLRAILRASAFGKVKIMYPMISSCEELVAANDVLEQAKEELRVRGEPFDERILRGSMIETPSAAVITDLLAEHCDFFSIGTNDLVQYMLAVDRINDRIAHLYEPNNPAIMRSLNFIFEAGKQRGIPVSVCGELAGDPAYAALLFGMGATELSVAWSTVPEIKYMIRNMSFRDARRLAVDVLRATNPTAIARLLNDFYRSVIGGEWQKA